ncbi:JmjC domain-containing protein 4 [Papilio machaon]|uniref:Jumonji domain-containing protein 4 n=1 Tax=Papilio machaon TaxID=76193 RepID=A0A0N0PC18_PAPMA|nr:JmjC domain-containing protein 4 [Papilio machaon]
MLNNLPCIIKNVSLDWNCSKKWIKNGDINYEHFTTEYGDLEAPVADCYKVNYNAHCKQYMKVQDYMSYLKNSKRDKLLYLKDWHLRRIKPDDMFYEVPKIFASDWLNEYAQDNKDDDFMFVYIGPEGSWTPLHCDVYSSYSWSVNIVGRKKWTLFPPGEESKLKDNFGNLPLLFNPKTYPDVKYFELIQEKGDAIFVPTGWHHQVENTLDTISINHNFINASNLELVWEALKSNLSSVEKEIEEFRNTPEFVSQCQLILNSVFGMDYIAFINFIIHIGGKRIKQYHGEKLYSFNNFTIGINHLKFDLHILIKLLYKIQQHPLYQNDFLIPSLKNNVENIIETIKVLLN